MIKKTVGQGVATAEPQKIEWKMFADIKHINYRNQK